MVSSAKILYYFMHQSAAAAQTAPFQPIQLIEGSK